MTIVKGIGILALVWLVGTGILCAIASLFHEDEYGNVRWDGWWWEK